MSRLLAILLAALIGLMATVPVAIAGDVSVRGYYRRDGTYVQPHMRSEPDGNVSNNWSTRGNVNPYTGKEGKVDPYRTETPRLNSGYGSDSGFGSYGTGLGRRR